MLVEAERVAAIPSKRTPPPATFFLERDQMQSLFAAMPKAGRFALRDRSLLLFLYNTGARVQETADIRVRNLDLSARPRVHLHGKGDKWRTCPLWDETSSLLKQLLKRQGGPADEGRPVFTSLCGQPLTRHGIYKIVRRSTEALEMRGSNLEPRKISPHVFRHYPPFLTMSGDGIASPGITGIW
jgi:site-specific recombinase XerD